MKLTVIHLSLLTNYASTFISCTVIRFIRKHLIRAVKERRLRSSAVGVMVGENQRYWSILRPTLYGERWTEAQFLTNDVCLQRKHKNQLIIFKSISILKIRLLVKINCAQYLVIATFVISNKSEMIFLLVSSSWFEKNLMAEKAPNCQLRLIREI